MTNDAPLRDDPMAGWEALEALDVPVSVARAVRDEDGRIVDFCTEFVNRASAAMSGIAAEEQIGKRTSEVAPELLEGELFEQAVRVIETGEPLHREIEFDVQWDEQRRISGTYEIVARKFRDGTLTVARDVSDRVRLTRVEQEMFRRRQQEQQARDINDQIIDTVVRASAALDRGDLDEAKRAMRETLQHASRIVTDLRAAAARQ